MHILVVNDDGPPSPQSSPYVHSLIKTLQQAGHVVSVVLPHTQRSWIGKAHMIGQTVRPTYFRPSSTHKDQGTTHNRPLSPGSLEQEEWVLVDGTPASCVQIGLHHYFQDRGPVDLVVSGPNYGRNSTAVFSLSSGTLGGAMEAALCKHRSIALSYGFFSRNHDSDIISGATNLGLRLIEHLFKNWDDNVDLYSINIPLVENVGERKIMWTNILQNYWSCGSCFEEVKDQDENIDVHDQKTIETVDAGQHIPKSCDDKNITRHLHKNFKWAPKLKDVNQSAEKSPPGNDGWAVQNKYTSVTPLKANFMHAAAPTEGELKLPLYPSLHSGFGTPQFSKKDKCHFFAAINYEDAYVQPLILAALTKCLPKHSYTLINDITELPSITDNFLQIGAYESLPFNHILDHANTSLINAYAIRKALVRKHYLNATVINWVTKYPFSTLKRNYKISCDFELDYAEFLDDAIVDAWELQDSFKKNSSKSADQREWWILKPGMSDRGQGIRLFSTEQQLLSIFEDWEAQLPESDDDEDDRQENRYIEDSSILDSRDDNEIKDYLIISDLRHFVAQPYIHPPLLIKNDPRKFHIRAYALAVGNLKVYVFQDMLALFSCACYTPPWTAESPTDLAPHLTNTCLQTESNEEIVKLFSSLEIPALLKRQILSQIYDTTGEIFEAAARCMTVHFQTIPNAFEVFGLDFLVDEAGTAWLLEVNAFPDFKQTGEALQTIIQELWEGVINIAIRDYFGFVKDSQDHQVQSKMNLVRNIALTKN